MKWIPAMACMLALFSIEATAQGAPQLKCAVRYQGQVTPMYWFGGDAAHHLNGPDSLSVIVKEKATPDKVEIKVVEMVEDGVWNKLVEMIEKSEADPDLRGKLRDLGRTRITTAFVGFYSDVLHFEHRLGKDPSLFEVSCAKLRPTSKGSGDESVQAPEVKSTKPGYII